FLKLLLGSSTHAVGGPNIPPGLRDPHTSAAARPARSASHILGANGASSGEASFARVARPIQALARHHRAGAVTASQVAGPPRSRPGPAAHRAAGARGVWQDLGARAVAGFASGTRHRSRMAVARRA